MLKNHVSRDTLRDFLNIIVQETKNHRWVKTQVTKLLPNVLVKLFEFQYSSTRGREHFAKAGRQLISILPEYIRSPPIKIFTHRDSSAFSAKDKVKSPLPKRRVAVREKDRGR